MARSRGRRDHLEVIAIVKHAPTAPPELVGAQDRVDIARRRDLESLKTPREYLLVLGLDQHVNVVTLQRDVHDADPLSHCRDDRRFAQSPVHVAAAQTSDGRHNAQHDM